MTQRTITGKINRESVEKWNFTPDDPKFKEVDALADLLVLSLSEIPVGKTKRFNVIIEVI